LLPDALEPLVPLELPPLEPLVPLEPVALPLPLPLPSELIKLGAIRSSSLTSLNVAIKPPLKKVKGSYEMTPAMPLFTGAGTNFQ
jgi:hypothetical protein